MFIFLGVAYFLSAILLARQMHKTQVCLYMAKKMAGTDASQASISGFQNALSDPKENPIFFLSAFGMLITIIGYFYFGGVVAGLASLVGFWILLFMSRKFVFRKEDSPEWVIVVHRSLCRREADYAKSNDSLRQSAIRSLREEFEIAFEDAMKKLY